MVLAIFGKHAFHVFYSVLCAASFCLQQKEWFILEWFALTSPPLLPSHISPFPLSSHLDYRNSLLHGKFQSLPSYRLFCPAVREISLKCKPFHVTSQLNPCRVLLRSCRLLWQLKPNPSKTFLDPAPAYSASFLWLLHEFKVILSTQKCCIMPQYLADSKCLTNCSSYHISHITAHGLPENQNFLMFPHPLLWVSNKSTARYCLLFSEFKGPYIRD